MGEVLVNLDKGLKRYDKSHFSSTAVAIIVRRLQSAMPMIENNLYFILKKDVYYVIWGNKNNKLIYWFDAFDDVPKWNKIKFWNVEFLIFIYFNPMSFFIEPRPL